ncbi:MAG: molybdenum cofactor guanylyltransferase [Solirubrobacterales bacterium]
MKRTPARGVSELRGHTGGSNSDRSGKEALGALLAGGRGSRLGGGKAWVELGGRPLVSYPLAAIEAAGLDPVVCVKPTEFRGSFRSLSDRKEPRNGVTVLEEPERPRHPLCGIVAVLRAGEGRPVVAVACDLPFVAPALLEFLAAAPEPLVVPVVEGRPQPLLARYEASLLPELEAALEREEPLVRAVESLRPRLLNEAELARFGDPRRLLFNVNDPDDLREAETLLAS